MQRLLTVTDALDVIGLAGALHDAPEPVTMLQAMPRLIGDLIPYDVLELVGAGAGSDPLQQAMDHSLAVPTPDAGGLLAGLVLWRRARPFGRRETALAGLLGPLIGHAADHVRLKVANVHGPDRLAGLTVREREVLALVADGRSTRDIAVALFIEARTVEKHMEHVKSKLGARSRAEAAATWARSVALAS